MKRGGVDGHTPEGEGCAETGRPEALLDAALCQFSARRNRKMLDGRTSGCVRTAAWIVMLVTAGCEPARKWSILGGWKQKRSLVAVILVSGLLSACDGDGPTQPTGPAQPIGPTQPSPAGVTLYEHPDYEGASYMLTHNEENLDSERGPCKPTSNSDAGRSWDNCVSSIDVGEGWQVTVYERDDYGGPFRTFTASVANLREVTGGANSCNAGWNDCISSVRVSPIN